MPTRLPIHGVPKRHSHKAPRPSAAARGYGRDWRRRREQVLASQPLCVECKAQGRTVAATDVDHIRRLADGGDGSDANLQPLCHRCHARKTARVDGGLGRPRSAESR